MKALQRSKHAWLMVGGVALALLTLAGNDLVSALPLIREGVVVPGTVVGFDSWGYAEVRFLTEDGRTVSFASQRGKFGRGVGSQVEVLYPASDPTLARVAGGLWIGPLILLWAGLAFLAKAIDLADQRLSSPGSASAGGPPAPGRRKTFSPPGR